MNHILAVGTFTFDIAGDGTVDEMEIPFAALRTPAPFNEGMLPVGILSIKQPPNTTHTFENGVLKIKFAIPPSSSKVIIEALYGKNWSA